MTKHVLSREPSGEPVAVVGMACRFPGAPDLPAFWRLLEAGESGVIEGVPGSGVGRIGELFPNADVQSEACRFGAFVDDIDRFDAAFFRISPVEAQLLDPQQRMMLETSWQALEDAGIDAEGLAGSRTGVYAGISNYDYRWLIMDSTDSAEPITSLYSVSGTSFNTAIGRVAFALGLHGPAMAVDTACSSSLVAVHQAVVGLQRGEADLALAGGVHAIVSGRLTELRGNAGMLAPDGQCKTFDAAANGYVRGEGCGIVVLKRLSEAEADGDRIWGVIAGSAVNQDGATPGLTIPSGEAQERVVEDALARAGLQASDVDYVETHGTGTPVGDPIEAQAIGTAYSRGRDAANPLLIGSVKTNIGHLEAAAGVAGLMKAMLAVERGLIPRHLNFRDPNPAIDWEQLPLRVTTEATPWPAGERPPLAGVSAFGWSGTNAHVLVRGHGPRDGEGTERAWTPGPPHPVAVPLPEPAPDVAVETRATRLLPLSGKSDEALGELAGRYLEWLGERSGELEDADTAGQVLPDIAWTAGVGRSHFGHRAGVAFRDADSLREGLRALAEAATGHGPSTAKKVAFAYTGGSSQWVGMGKALYEREPVARAVLDRCAAVFREERGESLLDVMFGRSDAGDLDDADWMQPALYAVECALTALWESVGVRPDVVLGHSLGEAAAAQAAGVYSLEDGMRFTARRSVLMVALPDKGAMAAVFAPADRVAAAVAEQNAASPGPDLNIAADNGVQQTVSGPEKGVQALVERFNSEGLWARQLQKSLAYHSVLVEPALGRPRSNLRGLGRGAAVDRPDQQHDGSAGRTHHEPRRVVLAPARAGAGRLPRVHQHARGGGGGRGRGGGAAGGIGDHDRDELAGREGAGVHHDTAWSRRYGGDGRQRLRGGGGEGVRGRVDDFLRGAVRGGGAAAHLAADLPVPATAVLGGGAEAAAAGIRASSAGGSARVAAGRGAVRDGAVGGRPGVAGRPPRLRARRGSRRSLRRDGGGSGFAGRRRSRGGGRPSATQRAGAAGRGRGRGAGRGEPEGAGRTR